MSQPIIKLKSDFHDFYDHWFAGSGQCATHEFERLTTGGMSRREMLAWFDEAGFLTPRHGLVRDLVATKAIGQVVVYTDENAHCGEGKIKLFASDALQYHPDCYATEYIPTTRVRGTGEYICPDKGVSFRALKIGNKGFLLKYDSIDDWRSNCGNCYSEVVNTFVFTEAAARHVSKYPLLAIDYVKQGNNLLAIDFNKAPGLRKSGIEKFMTAQQVYDEIAGFIADETNASPVTA